MREALARMHDFRRIFVDEAQQAVFTPLNACFASHLDDLLGSDKAALWIHGHMHHSVDYHVRGTRVLCNPRGYVTDRRSENAAFDPGLCVELS
ncbi:MAG: hypothetical protein EOO24_40935 [Comamonadaceae bacterium]|nr:MAG: hypothetical protein EOO24_40935 [Comamonadaceae bacterium]